MELVERMVAKLYTHSEIRQKLDYVHENPVDEVFNMLIATRWEARGSGDSSDDQLSISEGYRYGRIKRGYFKRSK